MSEITDPKRISRLQTINNKLRSHAPGERAEQFKSLSESERQSFRAQHDIERFEVSVRSTGLTLGEETREVTVSAYSTLGFHLWDWILEASWKYDGKIVKDVHVTDYADVYDWCWSYEGTNSESFDVDENQFEARRQGSLSCQAAWGVVTFNADPYARVKGYSDGDFEVLEKSDSPAL